MEKVRISKSQADALESAVKSFGKSSVLTQHANDETNWCNSCEGLNLMPLMTLASALVNEYEVEETPEDKIKAQYQDPKGFFDKERETATSAYLKGIKFTLDTLNIKIEGIN